MDNYGSVENILESVDSIAATKPSMARHLRENQDLIRKFVRLTTLQNVSDEMDIHFDAMRHLSHPTPFDIKQIHEEIKEFYRKNKPEISEKSDRPCITEPL